MPIAIVTGGNSGIGRATSALLAERGFDVGLTFHTNEEQAREAAAECAAHGVRTAVRATDLKADVRRADAVESLAAELGGVDVFVNNAGGAHESPVLEMRLDDWRRTLDLDLTGAFLCLQHAARRMVPGGRGPEPRAARSARPPGGGPANAREIAGMIGFLASPRAPTRPPSR